jgi:hypothetical protein
VPFHRKLAAAAAAARNLRAMYAALRSNQQPAYVQVRPPVCKAREKNSKAGIQFDAR